VTWSYPTWTIERVRSIDTACTPAWRTSKRSNPASSVPQKHVRSAISATSISPTLIRSGPDPTRGDAVLAARSREWAVAKQIRRAGQRRASLHGRYGEHGY
jgi:hypothetical protein